MCLLAECDCIISYIQQETSYLRKRVFCCREPVEIKVTYLTFTSTS